jgi:hypothetical protein
MRLVISLIPAYPSLQSHEPGMLIGAGRVNMVCDHVAGDVIPLRPGVAVW